MLHHFPNKQALIFALFARLLAIMEEAISALMAADKTAYGTLPVLTCTISLLLN